MPTIEINSVNEYILTRFGVDCSKFKETFDKREIKKKKIEGQEQINELISELEKLKIVDSRKND